VSNAPDDAGAPRAHYERRHADRRASLALLDKRDRLVSALRLASFGAGVVLGILMLATDLLSPLWLIAPAAVYVVLVVIHDRIINKKNNAAGAVAYYEALLRRLDHRWHGKGVQGAEYVADVHPYAIDLDLFGEGSLFELLCTARTRAGEQTLASWLNQPAQSEEIRARQEAVAELRSRLDLREDLALLGGGVRATLQPDVLVAWASQPAAFPGASVLPLQILAWTLSLCAVVGAALWAFTDRVGPLPLLGLVVVVWAVGRWLKPRLSAVVETIDRAERELQVLTGILARLEREQVSAEKLVALQRGLSAGGRTASGAIRRLDRLVMWLDARRNALFAPVGFLLMWTLHFGLAIEAWRLKAGERIPPWLEAIGEFEALCALAGYAYEHPDDPFPTLLDLVDGPLFDGEDLGHPLLPDDVCVRNSVRLGGEPRDDESDPCGRGARALIISGSNMSGKSTLLRTVGVNAVLALAGAPVRASRLKLSPLAVGATIRIHDSLLEGSSRFYAEISRLKLLEDLADGEVPLLFLLDEILHGTNSHDRRIGATALLAELVQAGAVGLVTTHDLALSEAAGELDSQVENVHFSDRIEDGKLVFDYKMKPGVVQGSNAIKLMRAVGLRV
jgi:MutS domain V/MutS domain III